MVTPDQLEQLKTRFSASQQLRSELVQLLATMAPTRLLLCQLPAELQTRPLHRFDAIAVNSVSSSEGHPLITDAVNDLFRRSNDIQSQRVRRYPGVICFNANHNQALKTHCDQLYSSIDQFKQLLHQITESAANKQDLRFEILHNVAPNLITMHFYRSPMYIEPKVARIRFGWVAKRIVSKVSKQQILTRLKNSLTNPGKVIADMPVWRANIEREFRAIDSLPAHVQLRIDREGGLRPTAFIQFAEGGRTQMPANLPLILQQDEEIEIAPLPTWQHSDYPPAKGELLIPRLHLYRIN